ncbi:MAG: NDP-sugar synthase [Candidatus Aminicenantes bacterium]|nr:MAG: NDP-sugar synthase [Candidatus Aminicenantes bacterium]
MTNNCKFFILAGGYGKRAQPLSLIKPKPLFPLNGKPLIQILLDQLLEKGLHEGFINLHHMPQPLRQCVEKITKKPGSPVIRFLYEETLSGSRILKEAAEHMPDDGLLLVVNGDIFLEIPFEKMLDKILKEQADGILLVRKNKEKDSQYKIVLTRGERFAGRKIFSSSDRESIDEPLMYIGVSLFKKNVVQAIDEINFFDMLEKSHFKIKIFNYNGPWLDIGDPKSYLESDSQYKKNLGIETPNSFSENVFISPDSVVKDCIIWENTRIINKSVIKNCIVTGNVSLDNVHYENKIINRDSVEDGFML